MKTKILAVATLALMAAACQKNGGESPESPVNKTIDLATVTENTTVGDGYTVTGILGGNYKISIADGATVTLDNAVIRGANDDEQYDWAGLTCEGDATLILSGTSKIGAFYIVNPGIYVPGDKEDASKNKTLTIRGEGTLSATGFNGAGIGGGAGSSCGNIVIKSGSIIAQGGYMGAGIGSGANGSCGDISIEGGIIYAQGGTDGAGIGCGDDSTCGDITIKGGAAVTAVGDGSAAGIGSSYEGTCGDITVESSTAYMKVTKGDNADWCIGEGKNGDCGVVLINGTEGHQTGNPLYYPENTIKLDYVLENTVVPTGMTVTGTLKGNYKISIENGAEVTLEDATINGTNDVKYKWAGITCEGSATLFVKGENRVKGFCKGFPGIYVPTVKQLTICCKPNEKGKLHVSNNGNAAGIGAGQNLDCGSIIIDLDGGTVYADGDLTNLGGAGIGGCYEGDCEAISISSGTVFANGGPNSAGIGGGYNSNCAMININNSPDIYMKVTRGKDSPCTIGKGAGASTCAGVFCPGVTNPITDNPFIYPIELLATINSNENTDFLSGTKNFGNAILSITGETATNDGTNNGWYAPEAELGGAVYLTVGAAEGYTLTRIEFDLKNPSSDCKMTEKTRFGTFIICVTSNETYNCKINEDGSYRQGSTLYGQQGPNCIRVYGYKN